MSEEEGVSPNRICPHCGRPLDMTWKACPYCGGNHTQPPPSVRYELKSQSRVWYPVPLLSGIVGGPIGYVGTKDRDKDMATSLLVFGILWSFVLGLFSWAWVTSLWDTAKAGTLGLGYWEVIQNEHSVSARV